MSESVNRRKKRKEEGYPEYASLTSYGIKAEKTSEESGFKAWMYENRFIIISFLIAAAIMLFSYMLRGVFPFGKNIVLKVDLYHQYAPFHEELRSRIFAGKSLFYSWEGGLGKEFFTQMAYYTASPISILILTFTQGALPEALALFILIKIAFCSAFFSFYLKKRFDRNDISIVIFGLFYAFTAYLTGYYWNVMWLDAVALFPVVAMGIERLVLKGRVKLYCLSLALVILINFYIAFLVCVFAALYYLVVLFSNYSFKKNMDKIVDRTIKFAILSVLAGGISMFLTIPTAIALSHTDTSNTGFPSFEIYKNIYQLITNHFIGARPVVLARNEDLPNVFSGILSMMLLPLYFSNKKISVKEKVGYVLLLLFMLLCACVKPLDYLIHGAHFPSNLPHRYTFIYSFILIVAAYKAFIHIKDCDVAFMNIAAVIYVCVIIFTEYVLVRNISDIDRVLSDTDILINIIAMVIYVVIINIYYNSEKREYGVLFYIFLVFAISECAFSSFEGLDRTTSRTEYTKYIPATEEALKYIDENEEDPFYRSEFRRFTTINDGALYHYNGFSIFSSLAPGGISNFIGNLGIAATGNSYRYYDPTTLIDAMFDMKYVMNKADNDGNGAITNQNYELVSKFENEDGIGNVWVYKNNRVLPLGFMTDKAVEEWETTDSMPFDVQNDFVHKATDVKEDMFIPVPLDDVNTTFLKITDQINDNEFKYELTEPANLPLKPTVNIDIKIKEDQYLFAYVDAGNAKRVKYKATRADGTERIQTQDRELSAGKSLFDIGNVEKGDIVNINFELTNKGEFEKTYRKNGTVKVYAAGYNDEVFQRAYDKLNERTYSITTFKDTHIEGEVDGGKGGVLFTSIPYVDGWSVKVDGQKTDKLSIGDDGVIGVEIPSGKHTVVFDFKPQGIWAGLGVSVVSFAIFVAFAMYIKKKAEESIQPSETEENKRIKKEVEDISKEKTEVHRTTKKGKKK
ncbi:MAG: YfhO family protein [Firmicutes bacterium]|nr:YfhO family protein [Bacillota bacterium]